MSDAPAFTVVIAARMRSTRLPGKMLADVAGKPLVAWVVERAREILQNLEQDELSRGGRPSLSEAGRSQQQLGLFQQSLVQTPAEKRPDHPVVASLRGVNLDQLTPLDALNLLAKLKKDAES